MTKTTQERFETSIAQLAEAGVLVRLNADTCCRSCCTDDDIMVDGVPAHLWSLDQDGTMKWWEGKLVSERIEDADDLCQCEDAEYDDDGNEEFPATTCTYCKSGEREVVERDLVERVCFYFDHDDIDKTRTASKVFTDNGFTVNWNGDASKALEVQVHQRFAR